MRMLLRLATLEEPAPHLGIHGIRQRLSLLIVHLWVGLHDLNQLTYGLLSGLEGPDAAVLLIRRTRSR